MSSVAFSSLDSRIQQWIWTQGWTDMREIQEQAIPLILAADQDVIIAAATASGKTEAAFFPILTDLLKHHESAPLVLYISPLKALINDQFFRLEQLCAQLEIPVWPWHGDVAASKKRRFEQKPGGVMLITPESLEAQFCNRGSQLKRLFAGLRFIVVDELHSFIGNERGKQMQSQLHRLEYLLKRQIPRIGLSATLGDMQMAADFLRPHGQVKWVSSPSGASTLKLQLKGYQQPIPDPQDDESSMLVPKQIASHLYTVMQGSNCLVFPNSRSSVELFAYLLKGLCEENGVDNGFWPHHGSLSKAAREETERALKDKSRPNSAICTSTLEMGIDIGAVKAVAQIGNPPSVASLRQRMGRSGRRAGEPAILRAYVVESELDSKSAFVEQVREQLVEFIAMLDLLLIGWFEPPKASGLHLSTLVQQILSSIAQHGGVRAAQVYDELVTNGAFSGISKQEFVELLRHLGQRGLLFQDSSGLLLHGELGERLVNHYDFYAAFCSEDDYLVYQGTELLGTLPVTTALEIDQIILFSGRAWRVREIDDEKKHLFLAPYRGCNPPRIISVMKGSVHTKVRQTMRALYESVEVPRYLDAAAIALLEEGRSYYQLYDLSNKWVSVEGRLIRLLTWSGDQLNASLATLIRHRGFDSAAFGMVVEVYLKPEQESAAFFESMGDLASAPLPEVDELLSNAQALLQDKWDWALPEPLLRRNFASLRLALSEAHAWLCSVDWRGARF